MVMRKRIYEIVEVSENQDVVSKIYDVVMLVVILASIIPLAFKESHPIFLPIEIISMILFIIDYILRFITADYRQNNHSVVAFIKHPFTFWAIIDLISILPSLTMLNRGFRMLRLLRISRMLRIFRVFKAFRYSKSIRIISQVMSKSKDALIVVVFFAVAYVLVSALVIFNVEPESFDSFFEAVYWATVSLTTVGYGDIYPVTTAGRIITMLSSVLGIAIIALPAGIITAGYMKVVNDI